MLLGNIVHSSTPLYRVLRQSRPWSTRRAIARYSNRRVYRDFVRRRLRPLPLKHFYILLITLGFRYTQASAAISCSSSLDHLTDVTEAVGLQSNQTTLAAGRCGSLCLQVARMTSTPILSSARLSIDGRVCCCNWRPITHVLLSGHTFFYCCFAFTAESIAAAAARCLLECTSGPHNRFCVLCVACHRHNFVAFGFQHCYDPQFFRPRFSSKGNCLVSMRAIRRVALHPIQIYQLLYCCRRYLCSKRTSCVASKP